MSNYGYGIGNFTNDIDKMIDKLVKIVEEHEAIKNFMDENAKNLFDDDPHSAVIEFIATYNDVM